MRRGRFIAGLIIGAAAGAALALAYAPSTGRETRRWVAEGAARVWERVVATKRAAALRAKGAALTRAGEMMEEAGRAEEELSERLVAEGG